MRVALIVPYFGKFPNYFQLVLKSCKANKKHYDWFFFTDNYTEYDYPENVKVFYCSFEEMQRKVQEKFPFKISLEKPYKFCDYRPAYGYIFEEYIEEYDFWGHCDIDCIYGKFDNFLKEEAFLCDKIMRLGHMTLYRNCKENNRRFMLQVQGGERYREVYTTDDSCIFDEENVIGEITIRDIWKEYGFTEYCMDNVIANTHYKSDIFRLTVQYGDGANYLTERRKKNFFVWDRGILYRLSLEQGEVFKKEYMYLHLMRRKMDIVLNDSECDTYKIISNAFEDIKKVPTEKMEFQRERWRNFNLQYFRVRWKNLKDKLEKEYQRDSVYAKES